MRRAVTEVESRHAQGIAVLGHQGEQEVAA
jgi:hypothetical protein